MINLQVDEKKLIIKLLNQHLNSIVPGSLAGRAYIQEYETALSKISRIIAKLKAGD